MDVQTARGPQTLLQESFGANPLRESDSGVYFDDGNSSQKKDTDGWVVQEWVGPQN